MDAIDALGEFAKGIGAGQERPGHKYKSRKRVGNRWVYDYGDGQPRQAKQEEGPKERPKAQGSSAGAAPRHWIESVAEVGLPKDTKTEHTKNGEYTPARKKLHERLISKFFDHVPVVPKTEKPVAVLMMGGTASGKSTLVRHAMGEEHDFVNVNADDFKEQLPEYQRGISLGHRDGVPVSAKDAASSVHEESSDLADTLRDQTIKSRKNMILDGTGKNAEKFLATMKSLKEAGYHVRVMMPHVKFEEAKKRAVDRANHTGRFVNEQVMEQNHHLVPGNFEKIAKEADDWALFDMGRPPPHVVWSGQGGKATIHDDSYVHEFQRVAKERHERAKAQGWMKSAAERTLVKAVQADSDKKGDLPPSVSLDDMLARVKVNRGEALDTATDLDDEGADAGPKPEKKVEKSMDAIAALEPFAKAGERSGHKYSHREADGRGGWRYFYKHPTKGTFAVPVDVEHTTAGHTASVGNVSVEHDSHVRSAIKHALAHANRDARERTPPKAVKSPHVFSEEGRHYGDTHLVSASQKHMPDMVLNHLGFGEFSLDGPRGRIDFNRMAGKDFPGQSGRSHLLEDDKGGALVKELLDKEHAAHAAGIDVRAPKPEPEKTEKSMDAIESLRLDAGGGALVPRQPSDLNVVPHNRPSGFYDAARSGTEMSATGEDARRLEEMYQSLFGKKQEHPTSEKQMKWAWSAEGRGDLPKGTAKKWADRFYGKMTDGAFAEMIGKLCADDETKKSGDAIDGLESFAKAGEHAGHKYVARKPNGRGGFDYVYQHPTHGVVHVATSRLADSEHGHRVHAEAHKMASGGGQERLGSAHGEHGATGGWNVRNSGGAGDVAEHAVHDTQRQLPDPGKDPRARGRTKKSLYHLEGDRLVKGGLYQFDLSRTDTKSVASVPDNLLYDYLCSFIEEACEQESRERAHEANDLAVPVMHELVQYVIRNPNLMRATKKYGVTAATIAEIIRAKGFAKPTTNVLSNDAASAVAMGGPTGGAANTVLMASMREDEEARPGVRLHKGGPALVQYPDDPVRHVGPIDPRTAKRGYADTALPVRRVNPDCIIHGDRDLTKSQNLQTPMAVCRC